MPLQSTRLREGEAADMASEGFFARMTPLMSNKIRTFVKDLIAAKEFANEMSPLALCDLVLLKDTCASLRINQLTQVSTQRLIVYGT